MGLNYLTIIKRKVGIKLIIQFGELMLIFELLIYNFNRVDSDRYHCWKLYIHAKEPNAISILKADISIHICSSKTEDQIWYIHQSENSKNVHHKAQCVPANRISVAIKNNIREQVFHSTYMQLLQKTVQ